MLCYAMLRRVRETKEDVCAVAMAPTQPPPRVWDATRVRQWMGDGPFAELVQAMPAAMDGKALMKMTAQQMKTLWGASDEAAKGLFNELRAENKRATEAKEARRREARGAAAGN